jgi:hypothetical protein
MEKNSQILIVAGLIITLLLIFVNIYLAGIVFILLITILMSLLIMQDTAGIPDIAVQLRDDAKAVLLTNKGNARAVKIHGALVPLNIEFDTPSLEVDSTFEYRLTAMVEEVKIVVTYQNENGRSFSKSAMLSALEEEHDPLQPMIPVFKWKK